MLPSPARLSAAVRLVRRGVRFIAEMDDRGATLVEFGFVGPMLFLMMMSLPLKMLARWLFNLKYIVAIPEFFFNI